MATGGPRPRVQCSLEASSAAGLIPEQPPIPILICGKGHRPRPACATHPVCDTHTPGPCATHTPGPCATHSSCGLRHPVTACDRDTLCRICDTQILATGHEESHLRAFDLYPQLRSRHHPASKIRIYTSSQPVIPSSPPCCHH